MTILENSFRRIHVLMSSVNTDPFSFKEGIVYMPFSSTELVCKKCRNRLKHIALATATVVTAF